MIDFERIRQGVTVKMDDGTQGVVKGSYMSADGIVLRVLQGGGIVQRNVPIRNVTEVLDASEIGGPEAVHGGGVVTTEGGQTDENRNV